MDKRGGGGGPRKQFGSGLMVISQLRRGKETVSDRPTLRDKVGCERYKSPGTHRKRGRGVETFNHIPRLLKREGKRGEKGCKNV